MRKARALRTIRRLKLKAGETELSDWEGEFLDSVETRIGTYGRAFADPEKGSRDSVLSTLQARKLKEIGAKADGEAPARKGFRRKPEAKPADTGETDPDTPASMEARRDAPARNESTQEKAEPSNRSRPGMIRRKPFGARRRES